MVFLKIIMNRAFSFWILFATAVLFAVWLGFAMSAWGQELFANAKTINFLQAIAVDKNYLCLPAGELNYTLKYDDNNAKSIEGDLQTKFETLFINSKGIFSSKIPCDTINSE